jgi:hypothetical protein
MSVHSRPVFIVGVSRSGTTLLRMMLDRHPRLAIPYEAHFVDDWLERATSLGALDRDEQFAKLVDALLAEPMVALWDPPPTRTAVLARARKRSLAGALDALFGAYADSRGKDRWGDKSDYVDALPEIAELFPRAQFVHIIRDGRDVAASVNRMSWGPDDVITAAQWWSQQVRLLRRNGSTHGVARYHECHTEDLVGYPRRALQAVCTFLGEEFTPRLLDPQFNPRAAIPPHRQAQHAGADLAPDPSRAQAWRKTMRVADLYWFERHARAALLEFGYAPADPDPTKPARAWAWTRAFALRQLARMHP